MTKSVNYGKELALLGTKVYQGSGKNNKLSDIFHQEVVNNRVAWYVDYFTEDAEQFGVRYLVEDGNDIVMMTNENLEFRDASDPSTQWDANTVAEWFQSGPDGAREDNTWVFMFRHTQSSEIFGIHCEPYLVFAFGSRALCLAEGNMWNDYVPGGILAPMKNCGDPTNMQLESILINPSVKAISDHDLLQEFLLGMAAAID